jgi:hypothetical protein
MLCFAIFCSGAVYIHGLTYRVPSSPLVILFGFNTLQICLDRRYHPQRILTVSPSILITDIYYLTHGDVDEYVNNGAAESHPENSHHARSVNGTQRTWANVWREDGEDRSSGKCWTGTNFPVFNDD